MTELQGIQAAQHFTQQYHALRKEHPGLPELAMLDDAFEMCDSIERDKITSSRPLRLAIGTSLRWVNGWTGTLHDLLLPNQQNAIAMQESSAITEQERVLVNEALDWIMYRNRTWTLLLVKRDDAIEAQFLCDLTAEWLVRRDRLASVLSKIRSMWEERMRGVHKDEVRPNYTG